MLTTINMELTVSSDNWGMHSSFALFWRGKPRYEKIISELISQSKPCLFVNIALPCKH